MTSVTAALLLFWRRARANWRFLLVLFAGILMATTLLAGAPLYLNATSELGLRHVFEHERAGALDAFLVVQYRPLDRSGYAQTREKVTTRLDAALGTITSQRVAYLETTGMDLKLPSTSPFAAGPMKSSLVTFEDYEQHSRLVEGSFPRAITGTLGGEPLEIGLGKAAAQLLGLKVGDRFYVQPVPGVPARRLNVKVTGLLAMQSESDPFWFTLDPYSMQSEGSGDSEVLKLPLVLPIESYLGAVATDFQGILVNYWWYYALDTSKIDARNAGKVRAQIGELEDRITTEVAGATLLSGLGRTLDHFEGKLLLSKIPILVMLVLVIAIVLYYLTMVASVVVERRLNEIALLRSRGANGSQVLAIYLSEALFISVLAVVLGPLLARLIVPVLGKAPAFSTVTQGALLTIHPTSSNLLLALLGGALSFAALALPAFRGARFNLLTARAAAARPARSLIFHRYFIDLFLLALAGILYWELTKRGSLVTQRVLGGQSLDWILLAAPVFFMVSVALLLLRLAPWVLDLLAWLAGLTSRVWLVFGLRSMARNPVQYLRPLLLVALIAAIAMFAASYNHSVQAGFAAQGQYDSGADARLVNVPRLRSDDKDSLADQLESRRGVQHASAGYRFDPTLLNADSSKNYSMLAVDTLRFSQVAFYREDFSERSLFSLMRELDQGRAITQGRDLPEGTVRLGLWVKPSRTYDNTTLWVRIRDAGGAITRYRLGRLDFENWRFLQTDLQQSSGGPSTLESIYLFELDAPETPFSQDTPLGGYNSSGQVNLSDLTTFSGGEAQGKVFDKLDNRDGWGVMSINALLPDTLQPSKTLARVAGQQSLELSWRTAPGTGLRGFFPTTYAEPLPVVASEKLLSNTGRRIGDKMEVPVGGVTVPVQIVDTVKLFPTMDASQAFVIGNVDTLLYYANLFRGLNPAQPNEVWMALDASPAEQQAFVREIRASELGPYLVYERPQALLDLQSDPLVGNGSRAIFFAIMLVLIGVCVGGYLGYFYIASYRSPLEFAVLRTLGFTGRQLLAVEFVMHLLLVGAALAVGAWLGIRTHGIMLTFLGKTTAGDAVTLPLLPQSDWSGVAMILGAALVALSVIAFTARWTFERASLALVLRRGEG